MNKNMHVSQKKAGRQFFPTSTVCKPGEMMSPTDSVFLLPQSVAISEVPKYAHTALHTLSLGSACPSVTVVQNAVRIREHSRQCFDVPSGPRRNFCWKPRSSEKIEWTSSLPADICSRLSSRASLSKLPGCLSLAPKTTRDTHKSGRRSPNSKDVKHVLLGHNISEVL